MTRKPPASLKASPARRNRTSPTGSLRFDRRFPALGVPRLQHSSGTRDAAEFERRNGILTRLSKLRNGAETLQAFSRGEITIEDLVEFDRAENLAGGLRDLRAQRSAAGASPEVSAVFVHASQSNGTLMNDGFRGPASAYRFGVSEPNLTLESAHILELPLWSAALDTAIPSMVSVEPQSRRRYATSIRSLRQKLGAFSLSEEEFGIVADLDPDTWANLRRARMRGLTVEKTHELSLASPAARRQYLRKHDHRVSESVFEDLASLDPRVWAVLSGASEFAIEEDVILAMERLTEDARAAVRKAAAKLGKSPTVGCLRKLSADDWKLLAKTWGASGSDWNHMRRSLSAVLSNLFTTHRHQFRHLVIDAIPLKKEHERVPNLSREKLIEITDHMPEALRLVPWCLVATGCRIGEYLHLTHKDLKRHSLTIRVRGTKTEGSDRDVCIDKDVWWIAERAIPCPLKYGQLRRHWIAACEKADVVGVTLHDLRHCSGQWAVEGGADENALQDHLGHKTRLMTQRYTRRVNQGRAAKALAGHILPFVRQAD